MIYIDGVAYQDKTQSYKQTNNSNSGATFDAVLDAEKIIYATPENGAVTNPSVTAGTTAPTEMEGFFQNAANTYGLDVNLLKAVAKAESDFNASVVSKAGAIGVMQLMPATASSLGVTNPYNAEENIMGGAKFLSQLLNKYNGNISLALAAYNAGGNVDKYNGIPPFKETQYYVNKVLKYFNNTTTTDYAGTNSTGSSSAETIYATAVKDASKTGNIYTIPAVHDSSI